MPFAECLFKALFPTILPSKILRQMGRPADTRLLPEMAQEVCQRTGEHRGPGRLGRADWGSVQPDLQGAQQMVIVVLAA
jgi:hypothetical protein